MTIDEIIGRKVRAARLELGLSQSALAESIGVTFQQVQKYEKGVNRIAASTLYGIAKALRRPIDSFFPLRAKSKANLMAGTAEIGRDGA